MKIDHIGYAVKNIDKAKKQMEAIVADRLEKVHLLHAFHKYPSELSGGMKRRAALARAIALKPELLFCDERW